MDFLFWKKNKVPKWLLILATVFFTVLIVTLAVFLAITLIYQDKIYPGLQVGAINLSGKNNEQAISILAEKIDNINKSGIDFYYQNKKATIYPSVPALEVDASYRIIDFDLDKIIEDSWKFGRNGNLLFNALTRLKGLLVKHYLQMPIKLNEIEIEKNLRVEFSSFNNPAEDARLAYSLDEETGQIKFTLVAEKDGLILDWRQAINQLQDKLKRIDNSSIALKQKLDYPKIKKTDCLNIELQAKKILALAPVKLSYLSESITNLGELSASSADKSLENMVTETSKNWLIKTDRLADWLMLKISADTDGKKIIVVGLDQEKIKTFLEQDIAPIINQPPVDPKFEINNGKVTEFKNGRDGWEIDLKTSASVIEDRLITDQQNNIELSIVKIASAVNQEAVSQMGINEVVGTGTSNFAGSPINRRHNISVGSESLNGILIKPGEEFSLLAALGEIDKHTGYLPELVIKNNKTMPEYGGGLCQIGTTMFRAALNSGLPITMRRNHSYRVQYYEPAGTDATIYDPQPDFRFLNDTSSHLLIQTKISGNNLVFDLWGTKDGRIVEMFKPVIYNIKAPEPTKLIETLDLPPGEKKCTEKAHNGADAYFDYRVIYPGGEIKGKRFTSHYVPWQEVCLVGVEKLSTEKNNPLATSSPTVATSTSQ